jgi:uncharacterized protein with PQ loop repeat
MIAALGFLAAALSISNIWPQVWRSCRLGRTQGLSPTSSWLAVALNLSWLTFGLLIHDPAQIATHAVVGTGNTAFLAALLIARPELRSRRVLVRTSAGAAGLAALAAGTAATVALLGVAASSVRTPLGAVATVVGMAAALPQLLGIVFDRSQDLSGMSPARWYLGAASCTCWVSYGWLLHQPTMELSSGFGLLCAVATCAVLWTRRTAPVPAVAAARPAVVAGGRRLVAA